MNWKFEKWFYETLMTALTLFANFVTISLVSVNGGTKLFLVTLITVSMSVMTEIIVNQIETFIEEEES